MNVADGRVVKSLNGLKDNINLVAGSNITITPTGNDLTISATGGGGGGTVTQVNTGAGLTGGPITTTGTISVANDGITNEMLQNNSVTSSKIVDGTIASGDLANNSVTSAKIVDGTLLATDVGSNQLIKSVNSIKDSVNLVAGSNISITPSGHTLTISAGGGSGGGDITAVLAGNGLDGGGTVGDVTLEVEPGGITSQMLQNNSVTSTKIVDATITTTDLSDNAITTGKIADNTITALDLSTGSVTSDEISDGTVTTTDILNATITATDIANTQVVKSLNTLKDNVNLVAGTNITITPSGQNLTIASTSSGMGGSGTSNYLSRFTSSNTIGNSILFESSNKIGLNTTSPDYSLTINSDATAGLGLKISRNGGLGLAFLEDSQPTGKRGWGFNFHEQKMKIQTTQNNGYTPLKTLLTFDRNGNLGIGTESPSYPLHVSTNRRYAGYFTSDSLSNSTCVLKSEFTGTGNSMPFAIIGQCKPADGYGYGVSGVGGYIGVIGNGSGGASNSSVYGVRGTASGTTGTRYGIYGSAAGGSTNYAVYASGDLAYTGNLIHVSDAMFKQNINSFSVLNKISLLEPRTFTYTTDSKYTHMNLPSGNHYGLIAQELEKVFPELVIDAVHPSAEESRGERGGEDIHYKGVKYMELVPILVQAVKEQQELINQLTKRIEELERR